MNLKKKEKKLNAETLLVTIDIGKNKNYGYARCPDGSELEVFDFYNSGKGFGYFTSKVERYRDKMGLRRILFGLESTGSYGEALMHYLYKGGYELVQVNPLHTKRVKEIRGNSQNKTDKKDPKVIADIIALNNYLTVIIPEGTSAQLRRLCHLRETKQADINRVFNRIESLMMLVFPEFLQIMKPLKTKTAIYLLRHFATPQSIKKMTLDELSKVIELVSRKRLGRERAERLYQASITSGGISEGIESLLDGLQMALDEVELHESQLFEIEQKIADRLKEVPYSKFMLSIKGIGVLSAGVIIGEVGDLRKYNSKHELLKLAGLNLYEISSGEHKGEKHITKRGRSLLRKILFYAALNMSKKGGIFYDTYRSHLKKGMKKIKAITAISRKLLGIIYALVPNSRNYIQGEKPLPKAA
jgi:transposase